MKQISELKQGDKFYDVLFKQVKWYQYLCVHPTGGGKYHILIGAAEEPIRIYEDRLQAILDKNLNTYEEASLALAQLLEEDVKALRKEVSSYEPRPIEKDYEILSFSKNLSTEVVKVSKIDLALSVEEFFKNVCWNIHSVKRLSDGEIFTVGDFVKETVTGQCNSWEIKEFSLKDTRCFSCGVNINYIEKLRKVLFTTEDGVDIFEGDEFWYVTTKGFNLWTKTCDSMSGGWAVNAKKVGDIPFSTKEAAEEYILMNKPSQITLTDIKQWWLGSIYSDEILESLIKLVKSKL